MITSESFEKVAAALVQFQADLPKISRTKKVRVYPKDSTKKPYDFWYAPLDEIIEITRPILTRLELCVIQSVELPLVKTRVIHISGQFIETLFPVVVPDKVTSQGMGGSSSYSCRYAYNATLGIVADDDDDGNVADGNDFEVTATKPQKMQPKPTANVTRGVSNIKKPEPIIDPIAAQDTAEELVEQIKAISLAKNLEDWGKRKTDLIHSLPTKEQDYVRTEYNLRQSALKTQKKAEAA